jgi:hypothetical protein
MNRTYAPIEGGIGDYASGPEHQFFLWDTAASTLPGASGDVPTPTPRPAGIAAWQPPMRPERDSGGEFGGGAYGIRGRDVEMMRRGRAPFTGAGLMAAIGNAMGVTNPLSATAKMALGHATGINLGGWQDIPGYSSYDPDLIDAVKQGRMTRGEAENNQADRQSFRDADPFAGMHGNPGSAARAAARGNGGGGNGGARAGGGIGSGNATGGPGYGTARARGGRVGFADGGIAGGIRSATPGRSDAIETEAEEGTYIVPADVVSAVGEGNTDAGRAILDKAVQAMLQRTGAQPGQGAPMPGMARGGRVPIRVSGGEFAIPPHAVAAHGGGSHRHGANKLDALVKQIRADTVRKLKNLPPPRR